MATYYFFSPDEGHSMLTSEERNINNVLQDYFVDPDSTYMIFMGDTLNGAGLFLIVHTDNDFDDDYANTELPLNNSLREYFPNSKIVGNALLVQLDKPDENGNDQLAFGNWDLDILREYEIIHFGDGHPMGYFVHKDAFL